MKKKLFIAMGLVIVILVVSLGYYFFWFRSKPSVSLTVFIHGTVGSSINILNPMACIYDTADETTKSVRVIKAYRNDPAMMNDQIIGKLGFHEYCLDAFESGDLATYLISVYDEVARAAGSCDDVRCYATFGWSGLLSQSNRQATGFELYNALCDYKERIHHEYGVDPSIHIIAHSHGGNVALWLAAAEQEKKRGLTVDMLCMLGTPMQRETAPCIESRIFKNIILGYSLGDKVQTSDYFSTAERKSFRRMADVVDLHLFAMQNPGFLRSDMQFVINDDPYHIDHTNMWLAGRSEPILDFMDPLPLVVLMPLFLNGVYSDDGCVHYQARIKGAPGTCLTALVSCIESVSVQESVPDSQAICPGQKLYDILFKWRNRVLAECESSREVVRHPVFNWRNLRSLWNALWS